MVVINHLLHSRVIVNHTLPLVPQSLSPPSQAIVEPCWQKVIKGDCINILDAHASYTAPSINPRLSSAITALHKTLEVKDNRILAHPPSCRQSYAKERKKRGRRSASPDQQVAK